MVMGKSVLRGLALITSVRLIRCVSIRLRTYVNAKMDSHQLMATALMLTNAKLTVVIPTQSVSTFLEVSVVVAGQVFMETVLCVQEVSVATPLALKIKFVLHPQQ